MSISSTSLNQAELLLMDLDLSEELRQTLKERIAVALDKSWSEGMNDGEGEVSRDLRREKN